jgi:hypothetical protein
LNSGLCTSFKTKTDTFKQIPRTRMHTSRTCTTAYHVCCEQVSEA